MADQVNHKDQVIGAEQPLFPLICERIFRMWAEQDGFVLTHLNKKLPIYVSSLLDPMVWKDSSFQHSWSYLDVYTFPPFAMII